MKIQLNKEQKEAVELFYKKDIVFLLGDFGSGKTLCAVHTALEYLDKKECSNIWITRPILKNNLSTLPGTLEEKMEPYIFPIKQNIEICKGKDRMDRMLKSGSVKIMPIEVSKGVTFMNSVVIVDEFQDMVYSDFRNILTRLGEGSKIIFCGSEEQIDKQIGGKSCISKVKMLRNHADVGFIELKSNHRNKSLTSVLNTLDGKQKTKESNWNQTKTF